MKKIEATIQINKVDVVASAISDIVDGFTILEGNGRGSGKRQIVRSGRGTGTVVSDYNKVAIISTIVKDSEVEKISEIIVNVVFTGENGDGIRAAANDGAALCPG
ncbi:MAG: P-II family nitrogen regulator, partial [Nitrosopumilus sp.]